MVELSELKSYLKIDGTGSETFLQVSLDSAIAGVENFCNRKFTYGSYIQFEDGNNKTEMFIDNYPLKSIDTIYYLDFNSNWTSLCDTTAYTFILPEINKFKLLNGYYLPKGKNNIKVIYTSGFDTGEIYNDIKGVTLEMATEFWFNSPASGKGRLGKSTEKMDYTATETSIYKDMRPEWKDRLKKYRKISYK